MKIPSYLKPIRKITKKVDDLIEFEKSIRDAYEKSIIRGPVHLSGNNEEDLIEIFQYVGHEDWVFSSWRNHYHALLHGVPEDVLWSDIVDLRKSMSISYRDPNFYTSSIVGGIIPIALGVAKALKLEGNPNNQRVWVFVGDMTAETGGFHEAYKYSKKFELPIQFVVEDNNMSTNTPTDETWGSKTKWEETDDVIYYQYERLYPHHGIGIWVSF